MTPLASAGGRRPDTTVLLILLNAPEKPEARAFPERALADTLPEVAAMSKVSRENY
jgi:hypothetical protein